MLSVCLFAYRTTVNQKIKDTTFFLLYGRDAILPNDLAIIPLLTSPSPPFDNEDYDSQLEYKFVLTNRLRSTNEKLEARRDEIQSKYKIRYDKIHKVVTFKEGEFVMVFWPIPKKGMSKKLLPKWEGPFKIIKQLSSVNYRVEQEGRSLVVHVQRLIPYVPWES